MLHYHATILFYGYIPQILKVPGLTQFVVLSPPKKKKKIKTKQQQKNQTLLAWVIISL